MSFDSECVRVSKELTELIPGFNLLTDGAILGFLRSENVYLEILLWDFCYTAFMERKLYYSWFESTGRMGRNMFFDLADYFAAGSSGAAIK